MQSYNKNHNPLPTQNVDQTIRGLEGHPTELTRIRAVQGKLTGRNIGPEEVNDVYPQELRDARNEVPWETMPEFSGSPEPGMPPQGRQTQMVEAGVTLNNSPNYRKP